MKVLCKISNGAGNFVRDLLGFFAILITFYDKNNFLNFFFQFSIFLFR